KPPPLPPVIAGDKFLQAEIALPTPLLCELVDLGSKLSISGGSKSYKTWVLIDLALSVANGIEWIGFKTQANRVLYINFEIRPFRFRERLIAVAKARNVPVPPELGVWNLRGFARQYKDLIPQITEAAKAFKAGLVITDPI